MPKGGSDLRLQAAFQVPSTRTDFWVSKPNEQFARARRYQIRRSPATTRGLDPARRSSQQHRHPHRVCSSRIDSGRVNLRPLSVTQQWWELGSWEPAGRYSMQPRLKRLHVAMLITGSVWHCTTQMFRSGGESGAGFVHGPSLFLVSADRLITKWISRSRD